MQSLDDLRRVLAAAQAARPQGLRREVGGQAGGGARAAGRAGRREPDAHLRRPATRRAHPRPPDRGAGRDARLVLRLAPPLLRDGRRHRHRRRREARGPRHGRARVDERRRPRPGQGRHQDQRRDPSRDADRPARRGGAAAGRGAAVLHGIARVTTSSSGSAPSLAGWTLNEYALAEIEGGKVVASETEEQIYEALGLPFIPPVLREDSGEIEAAERGELPRALGAVLGDFHVHTDLSGDGQSSLEDVVRAARARGYCALAITDHAEGTLSGVGREALLEQREKIAALQLEVGHDIALLHGVELNIGASGELDYDVEFRRGFDFCIASVHDHFDLDRAAQTQPGRDGDAGPQRAHDRAPVRADDRRASPHRARSRRDLRRRGRDGHGARGQRGTAAARSVGRCLAAGAVERGDVRAHERRAPRSPSSIASASPRSTPSARGWTPRR